MSYNFDQLKKSPHPSGETIVFEEKNHVYFVEGNDDVIFTSGTTFLKKFFEPFDTETISARYAAKHGLVQEEVIKMWKESGRRAADEGTEVHQYMEDLFFMKEPIVSMKNERVRKLQQQGFQMWCEYLNKEYDLIDAEKVIASIDLKLAGMVDLIGRNKSTGALALLDYKTNKSLKMDNPWQTGTGPLIHLQDCNYNHYCLQLNLYQYLIEREGYFEADEFERVILHLTSDGYKAYKAPLMRAEIENMVKAMEEER